MHVQTQHPIAVSLAPGSGFTRPLGKILRLSKMRLLLLRLLLRRSIVLSHPCVACIVALRLLSLDAWGRSSIALPNRAK